MPGCNCWKLYWCWHCLLCQRVENADSGRHIAPGAVCHCLEVLTSFLSESAEKYKIFVKVSSVLLQVASRIRKVALSKWKGRCRPPLHHEMCRGKQQNQMPGDSHTTGSYQRYLHLWDCWEMMVGGFVYFLTDVTGICRKSEYR